MRSLSCRVKGFLGLIELKNIEKVYNQGTTTEVRALKGISLSIKRGEIFGVIGLSGAGKSTLIRHINMLERPSSGQVIVDGQDLTAMDEANLREARRHIGMIFQSFNLLSSATVAENIAFPLKLEGKMSKEEIAAKVTELLDLVGLADKAQMYPAQLSGGQKQRVGIARALANNPKILLCDEPIASLDPSSAKTIMDLLKSMTAKRNIACLVNLHQLDVAVNYSTRIIGLAKGEVMFNDSPCNLNAAMIEKIYGTSRENLMIGNTQNAS